MKLKGPRKRSIVHLAEPPSSSSQMSWGRLTSDPTSPHESEPVMLTGALRPTIVMAVAAGGGAVALDFSLLEGGLVLGEALSAFIAVVVRMRGRKPVGFVDDMGR